LFKFHLSKTSDVRIMLFAGQSEFVPALSLYAGVLPDQAHDDAVADPLVPLDRRDSGEICALASPKDAHTLPWSYRAHDGFRDTLEYSTLGSPGPQCAPIVAQYAGQFDAFASWSMANDAGAWSRLTYVASVSATPFTGHDGGSHTMANATSTWSSLTTTLPPGDYTIAAGDEGCTSEACASQTRYGTLYYVATPNTLEVTYSESQARFLFDGQSAPPLFVGSSYDFNVHTPGHPFFLGASGGFSIDDHLSNNGTMEGVVTFHDVPIMPYLDPSTTKLVTYYCGVHGEGGGMQVINATRGTAVPALSAVFSVLLVALFLGLGLARTPKRPGSEAAVDAPRSRDA
jgi:hypothetical protein